jgi:3-deoxy-D-manno-octulosonic-acid transferase
MAYLLNFVYLLLLVMLSPYLLYTALRTGKYREGLTAKLWGRVPRRTGSERCIWLHAVSVGEVNVIAPLLERLERKYPNWTCVISTTTKTGYELARKKYAPRLVFYCPLDFSWSVRRAMNRIRPDLLVLTELELWPNLIRTARARGIRVAVVNGRLSESSYRGYARVGWLAAAMLKRLDLIAVQNSEYAKRFLGLGADAEAVQVTGSIKFDGAQTVRSNARTQQLAELAGIRGDDVVLLAGSTQDPEESMALATFRELSAEFPQLRLIITPRHPERFDVVARMLDNSGTNWVRRSDLQAETAHPAQPRVMLVDAVGELGAWWGTAQIGYVGGSMGRRGGQNMIEPAAYGAAVSFGPNTRNFRDVVAMLMECEGAVIVQNGDELLSFVRQCLEEPEFAARLGDNARELVLRQQGAADRTCELLGTLIGTEPLHPAKAVA